MLVLQPYLHVGDHIDIEHWKINRRCELVTDQSCPATAKTGGTQGIRNMTGFFGKD